MIPVTKYISYLASAKIRIITYPAVSAYLMLIQACSRTYAPLHMTTPTHFLCNS